MKEKFAYFMNRFFIMIGSLFLSLFYIVTSYGVLMFIPGLSTSEFKIPIVIIDGITAIVISFLFFYINDKNLLEEEINKKDVQ